MENEGGGGAVSENNLHVCICRKEGRNAALTCVHPRKREQTYTKEIVHLFRHGPHSHVYHTVVPSVAENYGMTVI